VDHASPRDLCGPLGHHTRSVTTVHSIVHHRPLNSWVTRPDARASRAGVVTMPTSTSLCISSERFRPALSERNSYWTALTTGGSYRTEVPKYQGAPAPGGADPPRMGASAVHPRAGQVRRRPGNDATDGADQGELAPGDDQRAPPTGTDQGIAALTWACDGNWRPGLPVPPLVPPPPAGTLWGHPWVMFLRHRRTRRLPDRQCRVPRIG
jgi:hypothetical protein